MPETTRQLDEISLKIGELSAYVHEQRHGFNNLAQKMEALDERIAKRIDAFTVTKASENHMLAARITLLESAHNRRDGASGLVATILKSPILGWLAASAVTAWVYLTGKAHP